MPNLPRAAVAELRVADDEFVRIADDDAVGHDPFERAVLLPRLFGVHRIVCTMHEWPSRPSALRLWDTDTSIMDTDVIRADTAP